MSLFDILENQNKSKPLADKMRPVTLKDFIGQESVIGINSFLKQIIENNQLTSILLWGPPGCGKTTIARIIATTTNSNFKEISAVSSSIKDLKLLIAEAKENLKFSNSKTIIFIDEIHRYNKVQQDALLPFVEDGTITLIGATTENPSFEIIPPLRSRVQIIKLERLSDNDLHLIINSAITDKINGLGNLNLCVEDKAIKLIINYSGGDARFALNLLENASRISTLSNNNLRQISIEDIQKVIQHAKTFYDKNSDEHFDHLSAYQKSLRGSDVNASIYWLAKMIAGGEDPKVIARRLLVCASEDVSNADPVAFLMASQAFESVMRLGMPEARIPLSQATIYVALAPKSNSALCAIDKALLDIEQGKGYPVPLHLKDSHYKDAKNYGHGNDYVYTHENRNIKQIFLPTELKSVEYYKPKHPKEAKRFNLNYEQQNNP